MITSKNMSTSEKWTANPSALAHQRHAKPTKSADQATFLSAPKHGRPCQQLVKRHSLSLFYLGTVTWETVQDLPYADDYEDHTDWVSRTPLQRMIINFRLPFTSSEVNFQYTYGIGSPSYAMVITHIVEPGSELDERIQYVMLRAPNIADLNKLFSAKSLSLYSQIDGCNLFNVRILSSERQPSTSTNHAMI